MTVLRCLRPLNRHSAGKLRTIAVTYDDTDAELREVLIALTSENVSMYLWVGLGAGTSS